MIRFSFLLLFSFTSIVDAQLLSQRLKVPSEVLERPHELLIYTPPSYHFDAQQQYPVLYLMDGEYNFNYVTGLVELWSNISPRFPEMIVVGISGYDSDYYRHLMRPNWDKEGKPSENGAANLMIQAIIEEIEPSVAKAFRTSEFKILSGHSMGGLFTTYAAFTEPDAFNHYLAISPSLWWQEQTLKHVVGEQLKKSVPKTNLLMSLGNEKGMGVHGFLDVVEAQRFEGLNFNFKHFPVESHGSVGLPTYEWALGQIFADYKLEERYFDGEQAVVEYAQRLRKAYGDVMPVNAAFLRNSCYANCPGEPKDLMKLDQVLSKNFPHDAAFFQVLVAKHKINQKEYGEAKKWLEKAAKKAPDYFELQHAWYLWHHQQGHDKKAEQSLIKTKQLIEKSDLRQWQINELNLPLK